MSPKRPAPGEGASLFAAAGMEQDAPHPLPDRLRPRTLADVVGQDHILGPDGALVGDIEAGSPGARAGLRPGDLIVAVDGQAVEDPNAFDYRFATHPIGGTAQIDVQRLGKPVKLTVTLEPDLGNHEIVLSTKSPLRGAKFANISEAVAREFRLNDDAQGVVMIDPGAGTSAAKQGFKRGDIIIAINNQQINSTSDLRKVTNPPANQPVPFWSIVGIHDGRPFDITFPPE